MPKSRPSVDVTGMDREGRMEARGWQVLPMPEGSAMVTMGGGQALVRPQMGDDLELYIDDNGKGRWVDGYVALSGVKQGEVGGPYDGEQVVWVGKTSMNSLDREGGLRGDEWPIAYLRLARGDKPTFQAQDDDEEEEGDTGAESDDDTDKNDGGMADGGDTTFASTATFYRPDQRRGPKGSRYGGRWVSEGKGSATAKPIVGNTPTQVTDPMGTYEPPVIDYAFYRSDDDPGANATAAHERYARWELGLDAVSYGGNTFVADTVNRVLTDLRDRGFPLPARVLYTAPQGIAPNSVLAAYVSEKYGVGWFLVNSLYPGWDGPDAFKAEAQRVFTKMGPSFWQNDNPYGVLYHEMGHRAHREEFSWPEWVKIHNEGWNWGGQNMVKPQLDVAASVSMYATSNPNEFVAEVFEGLMMGKTYDADVMKWYDFYKGPKSKKAKAAP